MIVDTLSHASVYRDMPDLSGVFEFISRCRLSDLPDGRTDIDGDRLYVMIQRPILKPAAEALPEAHDCYIDLQLVLEGEELMGYAPRSGLGSPVRSDAGHDIFFYRQPDDMALLTVREGMFAVFYPGDAHAPCIRTDACGASVKAVFKIRL